MNQSVEKRQVEDYLRQDCEANLKERAKRYLKIKPHGVIPATHFAGVSAEVTLLFRDGHYYGCIALTQAVAEALIKFMCERNSFKPSSDYDNNVKKLYERSFIDKELRNKFLAIYIKRNDYHHLNKTIEQDRMRLEKLSLEKAKLLNEIEENIFDYTIVDGAIDPKNPRYWDITGNHTEVFLRLHP